VNSASTVLRGVSDNRHMVEILWHRRETRRQTEKTNLDLYSRKRLIYSTNTDGVYGRDNAYPGRRGACDSKLLWHIVLSI
jgi:hypothetical protein